MKIVLPASLKFLLLRLKHKFIRYDVESFWTDWAEDYFNKSKTAGMRALLLETLSKQDFNSILDFGCGYGRYLKILAGQFKNRKIVGVDISSSMLQRAKNYLGSANVELRKIDGVTLPFEEKSFDVTFTVAVLIHNPPERINKIIREIKRVTRICSIHFESVREGKLAKHCFCHDFLHLFTINGGSPKLLRNIGEYGKLYKVDWN